MINVTTFDGTIAKLKDCRKIKDQFYKKGEQCIFINQKWYRINSGLIEKEWESGKWYLKKEFPNSIMGIVGYNNIYSYGRFVPNFKKNVLVYNGSLTTAISENVLKDHILIDGIYYPPDSRTQRFNNNDVYGFELPYRTKDVPYYIKSLYTPKTYTSDFYYKYNKYLKYLLHYSWGVEIETSKGRLSLKDCIDNCLFPIRDGSISGIEYTTPPLYTIHDFYTLKCGLDRLKETGHTINEQCSLHVHIGGIEEKYISKLYSLLILIEKDIYKLFPPTYIKTSIFKRRDYNNPLKRINPITNQTIFNSISEINGLSYGFYDSHPKDPGNSSKWNIQSRYSYVNFVNYFFSTSKTVEFRIHTPTLNFDKIMLWMMFINSILYYVKYGDDSPKSVSHMLSSSYEEEVSKKLIKYFQLRKRWYSKKQRDKYALGEIYLDNRFSIDKL